MAKGFWTGVRLPSPPPDKTADIDRNICFSFLSKITGFQGLSTFHNIKKPVLESLPGGFFLFSGVAANCRLSKSLLCMLIVCFLRKGLLYGLAFALYMIHFQKTYRARNTATKENSTKPN